MNTEIKQENWTQVLEEISKLRYKWNTRIEVLSGDLGDQILIDKAPLNGITVQTRGGSVTIDLSVGDTKNLHQTHTIKNPSRVAFLKTESQHGAIVNIEQPDGTKTLIHFLEPRGLLLGFKVMVAAAAA